MFPEVIGSVVEFAKPKFFAAKLMDLCLGLGLRVQASSPQMFLKVWLTQAACVDSGGLLLGNLRL